MLPVFGAGDMCGTMVEHDAFTGGSSVAKRDRPWLELDAPIYMQMQLLVCRYLNHLLTFYSYVLRNFHVSMFPSC